MQKMEKDWSSSEGRLESPRIVRGVWSLGSVGRRMRSVSISSRTPPRGPRGLKMTMMRRSVGEETVTAWNLKDEMLR